MIAASSLVPANRSPDGYSIISREGEDKSLNQENTLVLRNADTSKKRQRAPSYGVNCIGDVMEDPSLSIEANADAQETTDRQSTFANDKEEIVNIS